MCEDRMGFEPDDSANEERSGFTEDHALIYPLSLVSGCVNDMLGGFLGWCVDHLKLVGLFFFLVTAGGIAWMVWGGHSMVAFLCAASIVVVPLAILLPYMFCGFFMLAFFAKYTETRAGAQILWTIVMTGTLITFSVKQSLWAQSFSFTSYVLTAGIVGGMALGLCLYLYIHKRRGLTNLVTLLGGILFVVFAWDNYGPLPYTLVPVENEFRSNCKRFREYRGTRNLVACDISFEAGGKPYDFQHYVDLDDNRFYAYTHLQIIQGVFPRYLLLTSREVSDVE